MTFNPQEIVLVIAVTCWAMVFLPVLFGGLDALDGVFDTAFEGIFEAFDFGPDTHMLGFFIFFIGAVFFSLVYWIMLTGHALVPSVTLAFLISTFAGLTVRWALLKFIGPPIEAKSHLERIGEVAKVISGKIEPGKTGEIMLGATRLGVQNNTEHTFIFDSDAQIIDFDDEKCLYIIKPYRKQKLHQ